MSYLSGAGYSTLEYASMEKSGYAATQLSRLPFPLARSLLEWRGIQQLSQYLERADAKKNILAIKKKEKNRPINMHGCWSLE